MLIMYAAAKSLQSCLTLWDPIESSSPGSPILGFLQARTLEWVAISFSNAWKWKVKVKSLSRVRSLASRWTAAYQAVSSIHGIFQSRVLEWGAIAFSGCIPYFHLFNTYLLSTCYLSSSVNETLTCVWDPHLLLLSGTASPLAPFCSRNDCNTYMKM